MALEILQCLPRRLLQDQLLQQHTPKTTMTKINNPLRRVQEAQREPRKSTRASTTNSQVPSTPAIQATAAMKLGNQVRTQASAGHMHFLTTVATAQPKIADTTQLRVVVMIPSMEREIHTAPVGLLLSLSILLVSRKSWTVVRCSPAVSGISSVNHRGRIYDTALEQIRARRGEPLDKSGVSPFSI